MIFTKYDVAVNYNPWKLRKKKTTLFVMQSSLYCYLTATNARNSMPQTCVQEKNGTPYL